MNTFENLILIRSETRLEKLLLRYNTLANARFYLDRRQQGATLADLQAEDRQIKACVELFHRRYHADLRVKVLERGLAPTYVFTPADLVVVIGQDGLVANTAKYALACPIVGVNPDPERYDGVLLPFSAKEAARIIDGSLRGGELNCREITLAEARLDDGQRLLAFNDLFIGPGDHTSARYRIRYGGREERQSSSGVIVATGAGSTGWLSSLFNMVNGMGRTFRSDGWQDLDNLQLPWYTRELLFAVREPFVSRTSAMEIVAGRIDEAHPLTLESHMPAGGVIFSDGMQRDFLQFNAGREVRIGLAPEKARLVV